MPDFPLGWGVGFQELITTASTVVSTAGGSTNTKGSWAELIAATARDYDYLTLIVQASTVASTRSNLVDLAIGSAGNEVPILTNYLVSGAPTTPNYITLPIAVAEGTRLSVRSQCTTASSGIRVALVGGVTGLLATPASGIIETLGAVTADSGGTPCDAGAVGSTLGAWAQLSAATTHDIGALKVAMGNGTNATIGTSLTMSVSNRLQVGVGSAGNEVPVFDNVYFLRATDFGQLPDVWVPVGIPAGSRVAARISNLTTDAADRVIDVVAYGLVS